MYCDCNCLQFVRKSHLINERYENDVDLEKSWFICVDTRSISRKLKWTTKTVFDFLSPLQEYSQKSTFVKVFFSLYFFLSSCYRFCTHMLWLTVRLNCQALTLCVLLFNSHESILVFAEFSDSCMSSAIEIYLITRAFNVILV